MSSSKLWPTLVLVAMLAGPVASPAAVIYNEAVSGDANYSTFNGVPPPLLVLPGGTSQILGTAGQLTADITDFDTFWLRLAPEQQITSILFSGSSGGGGRITEVFLPLSDTEIPAGPWLAQDYKALPSTSGQLLFGPGAYPLGGPDLFLRVAGFSFGCCSSLPSTVNYTLTINVTPVPLPAGALLFGTGLGLLSLGARRICRC